MITITITIIIIISSSSSIIIIIKIITTIIKLHGCSGRMVAAQSVVIVVYCKTQLNRIAKTTSPGTVGVIEITECCYC